MCKYIIYKPINAVYWVIQNTKETGLGCMFQYQKYSFEKVYQTPIYTFFFIPAFYMHNISRIVLTVINIYQQHDITSY